MKQDLKQGLYINLKSGFGPYTEDNFEKGHLPYLQLVVALGWNFFAGQEHLPVVTTPQVDEPLYVVAQPGEAAQLSPILAEKRRLCLDNSPNCYTLQFMILYTFNIAYHM